MRFFLDIKGQINCHGDHCYQQPKWVSCERVAATRPWRCHSNYYDDLNSDNTLLFENIKISCDTIDGDEDNLNVIKDTCRLDYRLNLHRYIKPPLSIKHHDQQLLPSFVTKDLLLIVMIPVIAAFLIWMHILVMKKKNK